MENNEENEWEKKNDSLTPATYLENVTEKKDILRAISRNEASNDTYFFFLLVQQSYGQCAAAAVKYRTLVTLER